MPRSFDPSVITQPMQSLAAQRFADAQAARRWQQYIDARREQERKQNEANRLGPITSLGTVAGAVAGGMFLGPGGIGPGAGAGGALFRSIVGGGPGVTTEEAIGIGSGLGSAIQNNRQASAERDTMDSMIGDLRGRSTNAQGFAAVGGGGDPMADRYLSALSGSRNSPFPMATARNAMDMAKAIAPQPRYRSETMDVGNNRIVYDVDPQTGRRMAVGSGQIPQADIKGQATELYRGFVLEMPDLSPDEAQKMVRQQGLPVTAVDRDVLNDHVQSYKATQAQRVEPLLTHASRIVNSQRDIAGKQSGMDIIARNTLWDKSATAAQQKEFRGYYDALQKQEAEATKDKDKGNSGKQWYEKASLAELYVTAVEQTDRQELMEIINKNGGVLTAESLAELKKRDPSEVDALYRTLLTKAANSNVSPTAEKTFRLELARLNDEEAANLRAALTEAKNNAQRNEMIRLYEQRTGRRYTP